MFMKKLAAFLTGAVLLALTLPVFAASQAMENTADAAPAAAQETAETAEEADEPQAAEEKEPEAARTIAPEMKPARHAEEPAAQGSLSLYMDGRNLTDGAARIDWPDDSASAPTAVLKAVGPDGSVVSPVYDSSDDGVVFVDNSGLVTAVGYGIATITATLDAQMAVLQVSVGQAVRRVIIIGEDSVSHGRSIKLRAFDQDGNRISAIWRSSSEKLASISSDGVLTAKRGASGQSVDITAYADEELSVFAVKNIRID